MGDNLTEAQVRALEWFAVNEPIGWFDRSAPSSVIVKRLLSAGFIEKLPTETMRVIKYQRTASGIAALAAIKDASHD